jgi:hypothetical protein
LPSVQPNPAGAGWLEVLDAEDVQFLKRFLLASGSLKALAEVYGVSYPTVRGRLDRLIAKVRAAEAVQTGDAFERRLRVMLADGQISAAAARELLAAHREATTQKGGER